MSQPNNLVSNGTCYSAAGKQLDGSFIPCGNDAFGHVACCGAGDNCLADLSCFGVHGTGYGSLLTYQAGCTDPNYKDASCPNKHIDQPWIALTLCDHSNGVWAVCSQIGDPTTLQPGAQCTCTDAASATVAFSDTNTLTSLCSLPESAGQSIQFFAGHTPTAATTSNSAPATSTTNAAASSSSVASTATSGTTSGSSSSTGESSASSASSNSFSTSGTAAGVAPASGSTSTSTSGLSTGAKAGIGVGAALGALLILAAVLAAFFVGRRRRRPSERDDEWYDPQSGIGAGDEKEKQRASALSSAGTAPTVPEADSRPVSEADSRPAQPWALGRSELEAEPVLTGTQTEPQARPAVTQSGLAASRGPGAAAGATTPATTGAGLDAAVAAHKENVVKTGGELSPVAEVPSGSTKTGGGAMPQADRGAGLAVVGPEGARFTGEQQQEGVGHRPWGWQWRDGAEGDEK